MIVRGAAAAVAALLLRYSEGEENGAEKLPKETGSNQTATLRKHFLPISPF